jgi:hypothetical protein
MGVRWIWSQSYIVKVNFLVAICWLAVDALMMLLAVVAVYMHHGTPPLIALPFRLLLTALGAPWSATGAGFDGMRADLPFWSANNLYYEVLTARGTYINATFVGLGADTWSWWQTRQRYHAHSLRPQRTPFGNNPIVTLLTVLAVITMGILQWTPYGKSVRLASAWEYAHRFRYFQVAVRPTPIDSQSGFPAAVDALINSPENAAKRRRDLTQLAVAIEAAIHINTHDRMSVASVDREMSAALLCIASSGQRGYDGGLGTMLGDSINTPARAAAFQRFLRYVGDRHTLPDGNGCARPVRRAEP